MSYSGLGTKNIPGQVNFLDPWGSNPERGMNRALRSGRPYAPYIEHGSWVNGSPDVVTWDLPEGAGLHQGHRGLGQLLTDFACSGSALNASWEARTRSTLGAGAQAAIAGGVLAGVIGGISKQPLIGAVAGAALAFGAFKVWTAPYAV